MKKASLTKRRAARKAYARAKRSPLGSGARFAAVKAAAKAAGAKNPAGVAYSVGVKKYGKKKMAALSRAARLKKKRRS